MEVRIVSVTLDEASDLRSIDKFSKDYFII